MFQVLLWQEYHFEDCRKTIRISLCLWSPGTSRLQSRRNSSNGWFETREERGGLKIRRGNNYFSVNEKNKKSNVTKNDGSHNTNFNTIFKTKKKPMEKKEKRKIFASINGDDATMLLCCVVVVVACVCFSSLNRVSTSHLPLQYARS